LLTSAARLRLRPRSADATRRRLRSAVRPRKGASDSPGVSEDVFRRAFDEESLTIAKATARELGERTLLEVLDRRVPESTRKAPTDALAKPIGSSADFHPASSGAFPNAGSCGLALFRLLPRNSTYYGIVRMI
jgi:hypothetical protein